MKKKRKEDQDRRARRGDTDPRTEYIFQVLATATALPKHNVTDFIFEADMTEELGQFLSPSSYRNFIWFYQEMEKESSEDEDEEEEEEDDSENESKSLLKEPGNAGRRGSVLSSVSDAHESHHGSTTTDHTDTEEGEEEDQSLQKRLFVSNPKSTPLKGLCICMSRTNPQRSVSEENVHREVLFVALRCGATPGVLLLSVQRLISSVFVPAVTMNPSDLDSSPGSASARDHLLAGLRSFASCLQVCEQILGERVTFEEVEGDVDLTGGATEIQGLLTYPDRVCAVERSVANWLKQIESILTAQEQLRQEKDEAGPQDELEYWRRRRAKFKFLAEEMETLKEAVFQHDPEVVALKMHGLRTFHVRNAILLLQMARSKLLKSWKEADGRVTQNLDEARDNCKFVYAIEEYCHPLYLNDPPGMIPHIMLLFNAIRMIHCISRYYNTSEKLSAILIKITNQMIRACRSFISCRGGETIWSQKKDLVRDKIRSCLELSQAYRTAYQKTKEKLNSMPDEKPFGFSEQYVFGKFDAFCARLKKILGLFDDIDRFSAFFEGRVECLKDILKSWQEMCAEISQKKYDYLEYKDESFEKDLEEFDGSIRELLRRVHVMVEKEHEEVWDTPMALKMLARFERISSVVPNLDVSGKHKKILARFLQETDKVLKIYNRQSENPPPIHEFPPIAGKIQWARTLFKHMEEPMMFFRDHPDLLNYPEGKESLKRYNRIGRTLVQYELAYYDAWRKQNIAPIEKSLRCTLVVKRPNTEELFVNWDPRITTLLQEAKCIQQMGFRIPDRIQLLLMRAPLYLRRRDMTKHILSEEQRVLSKVENEISKLLTPHINRVREALNPALTTLTWSSIESHAFFDDVLEVIHEFEVLVDRVVDIYHHRMEGVIQAMLQVKLYQLPTVAPNSLDEFLAGVYTNCHTAALELNSRSCVVEDAVLELIELVLAGVDDDPSGKGASLTFDDKEDCADMDESKSSSSPCSDRGPSPGSRRGSQMPPEVPAKPASMKEKKDKKKRELRDKVENGAREMRKTYQRRVLEVLLKCLRNALDTLRQHIAPSPKISPENRSRAERSFSGPKGPGESDGTTGAPLAVLTTALVSPGVQVTPRLEEVQEAIQKASKVILSTAKGVSQWLRGRKQQDHSSKNQKPAQRRDWQEKVKEVPALPKNYYNHICESKEITKGLSLLSTAFQATKTEVCAVFSYWEKYHHLWRQDKEAVIKHFLTTSPSLADYDQKIQSYIKLKKKIAAEPSLYRIGALQVTMDSVRNILQSEAEAWVKKYGEALKNTQMKEMERVFALLTELSRRLERPLKDLDDIKGAIDILRKTRDLELDMDDAIDPIEESFNVLSKYDLGLSPDEADSVDNLRFTWQKVQAQAVEVQNLLSKVQPYFRNELIRNVAQFKKDCTSFCDDYWHTGPMVPGLAPSDASDRLTIFQNRFDTLWRKHSSYSVGEELFRLPKSEFPELSQIRKELNLLQKLYKLYNDVTDQVSSYYEIRWGDVNVEIINNELMEFQNRCRKLPKALKEWPAFNALKKTIDDFNDMCPLLELMSNKAMKARHWQRIGEVIGTTLEIDSEDFCLKHIMEAPILQYKEDIEDICISAVKEKDIEAKLRLVTNEWAASELTFSTFKNRGELLLRGDTTAEVIAQLEDSLMVLGSLLSNRYNAPFRKQIQKWVTDLSNTNDVLERWLFVQNLWVYLEAVFVGGDIAKQLPKEAKRFYVIDKNWQKIMSKAHDTPNVVSCCVGDDMLRQLLPHLQEQLELCQKSLSGYLEKKRLMFPRFFFVSDPSLLEILGQASDSHTIQSHLLSIFDNTKYVKFHDQDYDRITAIASSEGEVIQLEKTFRAEGSVEVWLMKLLIMSQQSVHAIIRQAHHVIQDPDLNVLRFLEQFPAQVGILGLQMIWTRDSEMALQQARADRRVMPDMNNRFLELLNLLINQTTRDLDPVQRTKYETLITIHIHQRDIFDSLCRNNVKSVMDFDWLRQSRFYFKEDQDRTTIAVTDVTFIYQNEFLGCTERLVITPLTDRCYITLAQALSMNMGACPTGPAGTGKTETTKDMGKTLGKYVVVFNCSDQMDYRGLGRIYKGLAQSGSWGCFDEFNRILLPVLSVAAQQIAVLHTCKREKKKSFVFTDGDVIEMNPEFGIFLTMNLGYHGRQELPENLKIQFRNVAMMVPDRQIIIRVKLASCGFLENITLARKFYTLYKLCEEQLTKQVHYDFGLRNILSVLRTLGAAKRANPKDAESVIVMRVLRDMNLSKLVDEDEPLFMSLIEDLFPNMAQDKSFHSQLSTAIAEVATDLGLINHPPWTLKLIQLYETQRVRHGMMTLGPTGAGKTACIQVLMKALTKIGHNTRELRMNPKAITASQMFGRLDVATNDWTDGIFSALWRRTVKAKKNEHIWIVLDGPVDAIWIENLNSVLDDNKTLTLANGDRIPMNPNTKVIFEPADIDNASPATVSRNGMVYMSSSGLNWEPLLQAWLKRRTPYETKILQPLFTDTFPVLYTWSLQNLTYVIPILEVNLVYQATHVCEGLLPPEELYQQNLNKDLDPDLEEEKPIQPAPLQDHIERVFLLSIMWSVGAHLELEDRSKMEVFLQKNFPNLNYPEVNDDGESTIFDYVVDNLGFWQHWESRVSQFIYPDVGTPDYTSILVPNINNVRMDFLLQTVTKSGKAALIVGEQGSAKSVTVNAFMKKFNPEEQLSRNFNFSSASSPLYFQRTIESYIDKRVGNTFGPPAGKRMTIFVDDINMPEINGWGDQPTNEIVRQTIEMGGFYSLEKPGEFINVADIQFLAAMGHPGGGRNDIPSRLKRHFCIFNMTLPSDTSIDKIFGAIARGHFNVKRGFTQEVRDLLEKLIPTTRKLWSFAKKKLLPTPAKFHYVFNLRDLSRIWQGMLSAMGNVIATEADLLSIWKHECCRVISDRFTSLEDVDWFDKSFKSIVKAELGEIYAPLVAKESYFVDFLRDAPEPTGDEVEDADMEMPHIYEAIPSFDALRERLKMFLAQYNEMARGTGMDHVFFIDAMIHLVRISRIIRNPGGNALLVGVGGSGKQSLTRLASFIAGYKTFQITLSRSYNATNLLEDLKVLYRTCGIQGKGTTFLFTDQEVKEESFLEYLNNVLSTGMVSNLFSRDEQGEIVSELIPVMKREQPRRPPTPENVMDFFMSRTRQNLHVVLCFSPVGEKFRARAMKFPGLISGCTIDWFQPWPKEALVSVAEHFLQNYEMSCTPEVKTCLVKGMGTIHDQVSKICQEYFQRHRRAAHVTPKSFLSFINIYKKIYGEKRDEIGDSSARMTSGLAKLQEASEAVQRLKEELLIMEGELAIASEKAEKILEEVTLRAEEAQSIKSQVEKVRDKAQALVNDIAVDKAKAEGKLEDARPALEEAEAALNTIKPAHIATVRKLGRPPHLIMRIMDCVLILFQKRLQPVTPDPAVASPKPSWPESLKMLASTNFLLSLQNYPKDTINDEMVELLEPYFNMEDYDMETASRVCGDVAGLLSWTRAMACFFEINKEVLPLKANLALQESRLALANGDLESAQLVLDEKQQELDLVKAQYQAALSEKQKLIDAADGCRRKMQAAATLINGLGEEKVRWTDQSTGFKDQMNRLVGDVVVATAFLSYAGPFNQEYRSKLISGWRNVLNDRAIPFNADLQITSWLVDNATVSEWNLQGLPNDELSIQNGLIVTKASCYPLLVDPQGQGKIWIKKREANNELQITSLSHKYFRTHLEDSLSLGRPLLVEDVEEELDPVMDNLLERNFIKSGSVLKVVVGDKECDIMPGFMLYITTKLPNPAYTPEVSAKTAIIDFTVTVCGLEDQLLGRVIRTEKSELEKERVALIEEVMDNKRRMKELEDNLLLRLASTQGSLVDDEDLILVLQDTKSTAEEVRTQLEVASETEAKINGAREEYRPVATRGSILYFLMTDMAAVSSLYQTSLRQFLVLFDQSMKKSEMNPVSRVRIVNIISYLTQQAWRNASRGFYEKHKFLFTMLLAMKVDLQAKNITYEEFMTFIKGGASLDLKAVSPKPFKWILDVTWLNLIEISKLVQFKGLLDKITDNEKEWKVWFEKDKPEEQEEFPCGYSKSLDSFRQLLLVRSWCPDRTLSMARIYIRKSLGEIYAETAILDLEATWEESDRRTPLLCLLSQGSDPSAQIEALAKAREMDLKALSMGQGQESHARKLLTEAMAVGRWVLLQNCHLNIDFCSEILDTISDVGNVHNYFRVWLTTEYHIHFPIGLLQISIKFTNEPPQGIRASLKRTYADVSQDLLDYTTIPQWSRLLYATAFVHTVVQERRKFGALGWNLPYEFNQADFQASVQFIQNHLDDIDPKRGVSWVTICYMLGEIQYGGRVTEDFDKRLLLTFLHVWFSERLLTNDFRFYQGYGLPACKLQNEYLDFISALPPTDSPEVFGLHKNADITYQINTAKDILDTILSMQPKEGAQLGGETREAVVGRQATDMLAKLPPDYVSHEVREALQRMGPLLPMNIFLRQEIDRMRKVLKLVRQSLKDLLLAVEGTIIMTPALKDTMDAMFDARVPDTWRRISWESSTLGFWFTELLERDSQFRRWCNNGRPLCFWITGFFNPQGFLTAMRQEVTRQHKGWSLDCVMLQNLVTRFNKEDIHDPPPEGVYIYGLFLEGAGWDRKRGKLIESKVKILYEPLPVLYLYAMNTTSGKLPTLYECPIYRKPQRTDANYIGSVDLETDIPPSHWTLRGVALLCDTK